MNRQGDRIHVIEERLHDHERELYRTLEAIRDKFTSRELVGEIYDRARTSGTTRALGRAVRDNPIPTVIACVCGAWLAKSVRDSLLEEKQGRAEEKVEGKSLAQVALEDTAMGTSQGEEPLADDRGGKLASAGGGRVVLPSSEKDTSSEKDA